MAGELETEILEQELRSEVAHVLASHVRGMAILADLLAENLASGTPDLVAIGDISGQLSNLAVETSQRLSDFREGR